MKRNMIKAVLGISVLLSSPLFAATTEQLVFKNQRGSLLELKLLADNKLEGDFTTAVASKSCPQAINQKRPITGYVVGNAITLSVVYPSCESVLSITGNFDKDKKTIDTLSILNKQSDDVIHEGPGARFIGHDVYNKVG